MTPAKPTSRSEFGALLASRGMETYPAAEVGVAEGRFSEEILGWGVPLLYMVDVWSHTPGAKGLRGHEQAAHDARYEKVLQIANRHGERAIVLRGESVQMAQALPDGLLGFVHIDASHDYDSVLADLKAWYPKLVRGGLLTGHDFLNPDYGVCQAIEEFAGEQGLAIHTAGRHEDASFWCVKK